MEMYTCIFYQNVYIAWPYVLLYVLASLQTMSETFSSKPKHFFLAASSPILRIIHRTVSHEVTLVLAVSCWAKNVRFVAIVSPSRRHLGSSPIQPFLVKKSLFRTDVFNLLKSRARCSSFSESAPTDPFGSIQSFAHKAKFSK